MTYKKIFAVLVLALLVVGIGCTKKTGVTGQLILQTGQTGDVRNCRVRLFVSSDLTGAAVKEVASDATGVDQTKSTFEITDVVENYYYLLAWKDLNTNGIVDNLDIVGIHGGTYTPGYGGTQVTVKEGKMTDVGDIVMYIYRELIFTARYVWEPTNNEWIAFYYKFNDACSVTNWSFTFPDGTVITDGDQVGSKAADTEYRAPVDTDFWYWYNGDPVPTGTYIVTASGTWSGSSFTVADTLNVTH
jgi:hypothetical protein